MLQLLLFILIVSCSVSWVAWSSTLELSFVIKLSLITFVLRALFVVVILIFSFTDLSSETSQYHILTFFTLFLLCSFLYVIYSRILIKSFLRSGELIARFTLDGLPGEQLAVDISKRDGIISSLDAELRKRQILKKSIKQASIETSLKILSYEPFIVFSILIIGILMKVSFMSQDVSNLSWQVILKLITDGLIVSSMLLGSAILTVVPIIKVISLFGNENIKPCHTNFYYKVGMMFWKIALIFGFLSLTFISLIHGFIFAITESYLIFFYAFTVLLIYTILPSKLKSECAIRNSRKSDFEGLSFSEENLAYKLEAFDLKITLHCNDFLQIQRDYLSNLVQNLIYKSVAFIPVENFIVVLSKVKTDRNYLNIEWKGQLYSYDYIDIQENSLDQFVHKLSDDIIKEMLPYFTYSNLSSAIQNKSIAENQYAGLRDLDISTKNIIKNTLLRCLSSGLFVSDLGGFSELCVSKMEESLDTIEDSVMRDFVASEIDQLKTLDGACRIVFVEDEDSLAGLKVKLSELQLKLKSRNLDPLVVVVNNLKEENWMYAQMIGGIFLKSDYVPIRLNYFPLARI